jgi:hypothetical protein
MDQDIIEDDFSGIASLGDGSELLMSTISRPRGNDNNSGRLHVSNLLLHGVRGLRRMPSMSDMNMVETEEQLEALTAAFPKTHFTTCDVIVEVNHDGLYQSASQEAR